MNPIRFLRAIAFGLVFLCASAQAGEIEDLITRNVNMTTFKTTSLHDNYRATYKLGNQLLQFNRSEMIQMMRGQKAQLTAYDVRNLKIRILEQTENFATVQYSLDFSAVAGNTLTTGSMSAHAILINSYLGWQFLYEAVLQ